MENRIKKLKEYWEFEKLIILEPSVDNELILFQIRNGVLLPSDLQEYFRIINGTNDGYDVNFFKFFPLSNFKSINDELKYWEGGPDYSNIVNTLIEYKSYFVFADYSINMFSYAIKLYSEASVENQILVICGDKYKIIAKSFSEFIDLYLSDSTELFEL